MFFDVNTESKGPKDKDSSDGRAADELVSDAITNYKTVASFGHDDILIQEFERLLRKRVADEVKNGKLVGL
jgi:ABC-type transport system involved in Fe-S cluster assembly fused permease/ATPase subunit